MRRLLALLVACAILCIIGCANVSDADAAQDSSVLGENTPSESTGALNAPSGPDDSPRENNRNPLPSVPQHTTGNTLRQRATAEECNRTIDISAILPRFGVYENGSLDYGTRYAALLCQCATVSGKTVWLYISTEDYTSFFAFEADVDNCRFSYSDLVAFSIPIRANCAEVSADSLVNGLADRVGETVLLFGEAHSGTTTEVVPVMYTDELPHMTCVYADTVAIKPVFLLSNGCAAENTDVVCRVTSLDGSTLWVGMTIEEYTTWIDPTADLTNAGPSDLVEVTYQIPLRLYGVAVDADVIAGGLRDSIGCATAICFVSVAENG